MENFLEKAQKLYDEGRWAEAVNLTDKNMVNLTSKEETAEAARIRGWCFYYMGIKGLEAEKQEMLNFSRNAFEFVLNGSSDEKRRLSAFNGLPLSLWILGEKEKAWETSDRALEEFLEEPSAWNTRSILCRWAKDFEQSIEVCERVYVTALAVNDLRTAGHGKQNRGDALKEMGRIEEAKLDYAAAIGLYKNFEKESGQNATPHIEAAAKKLTGI
ncbi:MAG: hypothetical protein Q8P74_01660 [bacterium]|nr:hypothetical protein [bacterium]